MPAFRSAVSHGFLKFVWYPVGFSRLGNILTETGLRVYKELAPMRKDQVDPANKTIFISDSKTPTGVAEVPLSGIAVEAFQRQIEEAGPGPWLKVRGLAVTILLLSLIAVVNQSRGAGGADPAAGKEIFARRCSGCHATDSNQEGHVCAASSGAKPVLLGGIPTRTPCATPESPGPRIC
jgi:mono/diheme cytochrome c family protein